MDGVILCAGKGRRISELIGDSQKCMIKVNEKPIIQHTFEHFESVGIEKTYFVVGHSSGEVVSYFSRTEELDKMDFICDPKFEVDRPARSLLLTQGFVSSEFLYSHGEVLYERELVETLMGMDLGDNSAVIAISENLTIAPGHQRVRIRGDRVEDICLIPPL